MLNMTPSWVAVVTYPNSEAAVARRFDEADTPIEYYLPMLANRDRRYKRREMPEKPMFPGYLFAHINEKQIYQTRTTKGVISIVSSQHSITPVPDRDIEAVRLFEATQRKFYLAETSSLVKGARVTILDGEFAGMEGTLVKGSSEGNFCVSISVMNLSFVTRVKRSELRSSAPTAV